MDSNVKKEKEAAEVVVTKKTFNLACSWVQKMSGGADFGLKEEMEGSAEDDGACARPPRLGLGAKYLSHAQANHVSTLVDKKLRTKLVPSKSGTSYKGGRSDSKARDNYEEVVVEAQAGGDDKDEEDDNRASMFKKRPSAFVRPTLTVPETMGSNKKSKGHNHEAFHK